jgi:hypothetical protein
MASEAGFTQQAWHLLRYQKQPKMSNLTSLRPKPDRQSFLEASTAILLAWKIIWTHKVTDEEHSKAVHYL